jgi:hypothetical protein
MAWVSGAMPQDIDGIYVFAGYAFICETENGFLKWPFIYSKEQR